MKINYFLSLSLLVVLMVSCQDKTFEEYMVNEPVYMSYDELRSAVKASEPKALKVPGKLYFKDNYIFINEIMKGIHVYDNANPANPVYKTFIEVPGNVDMAMKDGLLYADSYIDLVALDVSDISDIKVQQRIRNVFSYAVPATNNDYRMGSVDQTKGVVKEWTVIEKREEVKKDPPIYWPVFAEGDFALFSSDGARAGAVSAGSGQAGSMARFMIYQNYLYAIDGGWYINVFDVSSPDQPVLKGGFYSGGDAETLFIRGSQLFIGGQNGMSIFSLSNPIEPEFISTYRHITACDPVVVNDKYAFVTLRSGSWCGSVTNQLDVVDIRNPQYPVNVNTVALTNPHGLGLDANYLFVCDGSAGLRVFDAADPEGMDMSDQIGHFDQVHAFDVIPLGEILLMVGNDGFYQYDYSNIQDIKLLSSINLD